MQAYFLRISVMILSVKIMARVWCKTDRLCVNVRLDMVGCTARKNGRNVKNSLSHWNVSTRSCAVITCNAGTCFNDTNMIGHCICPPEYTGEFCETKKTSSYNLFFNGLPSSQKVVSRDFQSTFLREFTLCAWVFYAPDQQVPANVELPPYLQLNTTTGNSILSLDNKGVAINNVFRIPTRLSVMAWHHICVRSPNHADTIRPVWTVFLDGAFAANASYETLTVNKDIRCRIQLSPHETKRFRGELSLVQLYTVFLDDVSVARMAFQCRDWMSVEHQDLLLKWTDFTTIQRNNPGVIALYPGLCDVSDCLPGRSNCNTKDKIPPMVRSCPRDIRSISSTRLTRVDWDTSDMFVDNVGMASVTSNYRAGQAFTWGYYRVVYVGSDAAGNIAFCSFSVVVSQAECQTPKPDEQLQGKTTFEKVNGTDALMKAQIECEDKYFPRTNPEFYVCDVMGQWDRSSFWPTNRTYSFPSCGLTTNPSQNISGSLQEYGNCTTIRQRLLNSLLNDLQPYCGNCTDEISINPICHTKSPGREYRSTYDELLNFNFYVNINTTRNLLKNTIDNTLHKEFPNSTLSISEDLTSDCPAGQYWNGDRCVECPEDTYRTRNDPLEKCMKCPNGTTTTGLTGQKDVTACHEICDAGEFYDEWLKKCRPCPLGTYQEKRGSTECVPCPADSTTTITGAKNASDCSFKCGAGKELAANGRCKDCDRGTYWINTVQFTGCIDCPQGLTTVSTAAKDIRDCELVNCPPGTHVNTNRSKIIDVIYAPFNLLCIKCELGTYQDQRNQTECKQCTPDSNCDLVNGCSPLVPESCPTGETCELVDAGVYSCSAVAVSFSCSFFISYFIPSKIPRLACQWDELRPSTVVRLIQPAHNKNVWVLWIIVPLLGIVILFALGVVLWIYRHSIYMMMCCKKLDLKNMESTDYYRNSLEPIIPRRRDFEDDYRNYPPRNQDTNIAEPMSVSQRELPAGDPAGSPRPWARHLPPPIITSRVELDLLEQRSRRQTMIMGVIPTMSKELGSELATGYSPESPGPSISAQMAALRFATSPEPRLSLPELAEDVSSSYSLHWTESSPYDGSNVLGDDDDEDYFG
ncbi:GCC2 and GCC3 [Ancylostoma caninum]|uniref:GCC2 and GCC3 n=1 Tax=Ancylostoma caninum TaxID=29170 RepID=A0A368GFK3_ANCCA|nr:GCC2 and GCC3 [Ancylostoma caninum]